MDVKVVRPRRFNFWRVTLKTGAILTMLTGLTVYAARLPDQYICLQVITGFGNAGRNLNVVDMKTGSNTPDNRGQQSNFGISSPDGKNVITIRPEKTSASAIDLVVQPAGTQAGGSQAVVVQSGLANSGRGGGFNQFRNMRWSPDSQHFAYLWAGDNQLLYLTVVNADGSGKQTALYSNTARSAQRGQNSSYGQAGNSFNYGQPTLDWSADGAYLSIAESGNGPGNNYTLWSVADLGTVDPQTQTTLRVGAWSPHGDQFGAVGTSADNHEQLVIWTPEKVVEVPLPDVAGRTADQVIWSPNGQYVVVKSDQPCEVEEACSSRWSYDIFSSAGQPIASGLDGASWTSTNTNQVNGAASVSTWTADGSAWVFLQDYQGDKNFVVLHVAENRAETIASHIVDSLAPDMMLAQSPYRGFGNPRGGEANRTTGGQRVILPTWQDGKINVEVADVNGQHRSLLVQGADEVLDPGFVTPGNANNFWTANGSVVVVVWITMDAQRNRQVHLTWAQADGSDKHDVQAGWEAVDHLQVVQINGQRWIGWIAQLNGEYSLEIADMASGTPRKLIGGLQSADAWALFASPAGDQAAIELGTSLGRYYGENPLYLAALDGSWTREVNEQAIGPAQWAPDGSALAYLHHTAPNSNTNVGVISASGNSIQDYPAPQTGSSSQQRLFRWTQCG